MSMTTERVRPNMSEDLAAPTAKQLQQSANPAPMAIGPIDSAAKPAPIPASNHGGAGSPYNYPWPAPRRADDSDNDDQ
jgi:hypothetical protein